MVFDNLENNLQYVLGSEKLEKWFCMIWFCADVKIVFPAKNFEKYMVYMFGANLGPPFSTDRSNTFVMGVYVIN